AQRLAACRVLKYVATVKSAPTLNATIKDKKDPQLAQAAFDVVQYDGAVQAAVRKVQESSPFSRRDGLSALAGMEPNGRRAEVAGVLETHVGQADRFDQRDLMRALGEWGSAETTVPVLLRRLDPQAQLGGNGEVINALVRFKDERAITPLV